MKYVSAALLLTAFGFLALCALASDEWLGLVAYETYYLAFCAASALVFAGAWRVSVQRGTLLAGGLAFAILASLLVLPAPSSARLLRKAMLSIPLGAEADAIEPTIRGAYQGSGYPLPEISRSSTQGMDSIHVSLISQEPGNCTAIVFLAKDGRVVHRFFSPD